MLPTFTTRENFKKINIGMTVEEAYSDIKEMYIRTEFDETERKSVINIYDKNNENELTLLFNPSERIVNSITTHSNNYPLESGFAVGDSTETVFSYYDQLYDYIENNDFTFVDEHRLYKITKITY